MPNQLESLKQFTTVVADTGDFTAMKEFQPQDATTNPSLILAAVGQEENAVVVDEALKPFVGKGNSASQVEAAMDAILVTFGLKILDILPGRVSTETDARLSFDTEGSVAKARQLIKLYEDAGVSRGRVLIKVASTWEGIRAAEILEKEGIKCNLTLLFSLVQAVACAEAKVQLISPFVGRIYDWYKKAEGRDYSGAEDPGVQSVQTIFEYYKHFGYETEIMGASFRNTGQIIELAGCDLLTISPSLLDELSQAEGPIEQKLDAAAAKSAQVEQLAVDEKSFRFALNEDAMATEKTAEGIRKFSADIRKFEKLVADRIG